MATGSRIAPQTGGHPKEVFIRAPQGSFAPLRLDELWDQRELLFFFAWRDVKVRYKQTALGVLWALIQPFFTMVVFSVFFGGLAGVPSRNVPYPVFSYVALLPWQYFSQSFSMAANSLVGNANMLQKVYFPRPLIPLASVASGFLDFGIAFMLYIPLTAYYGVTPGLSVLLLPVWILLLMVTTAGLGLWFSAVNVHYRDVRHAVPFLTQFWLFVSPIVYPSQVLHEPWRTLYGLNPMAGVIEGFRWALLDVAPPASTISVSALSAVVILVSGAFFFRRMERTFADVA